MKDLTSELSDKHFIPFLFQVLGGGNPSAVFREEAELAGKREALREVEDAVIEGTSSRSLPQYLSQVKRFIKASDAVYFLLEAQEQERTGEALEALALVLEEERLVDRALLQEILALGEEMPLVFAVPLVGVSGEERHSAPPPTAGRSKPSMDTNFLNSLLGK